MATPTNTVIESTRVNREESVQNAIRDISPLDTPMLTMAKEIKLTARYSEFLTDSLAAVDASNAHLDGDDDTIGASPAVTRLANRTQIVKKTESVSGCLLYTSPRPRERG